MRLPRDLSGEDLAAILDRFGYEITRQKGSHLRLTTQMNGEHHITIPAQKQLRIGTLSGILGDIADHLEITKEELASRLFDE